MMIERAISSKLKEAFARYPILSVVGPRQAGKTTLIRHLFPECTYISLEDPDQRQFAISDPRKFLSRYDGPCILDEVQRVPELFSYLQTRVDQTGSPGQYILSGSQNFLLLESISQSLAGRVALFKLLPFSLTELPATARQNADTLCLTGLYPPVYDRKINPTEWYADYIETYIERDVRHIQHITNLSTFRKFLTVCAAAHGQMINLSTMGNDCGISHNTVREWLSVLEASYIIFLLPPYTQKVSSRVRKSPKLFFIDPGLVATLLGIYSVDHLMQHPARGHLFESLMVSECLKQAFNRRLPFTGYFWRDREGHEIDIIIDRPDGPIAIECKASHTIRTDDFRHLIYFGSKAEIPVDRRYLLYGGDDSYSRSDAQVLSWKDVADGTIIF